MGSCWFVSADTAFDGMGNSVAFKFFVALIESAKASLEGTFSGKMKMFVEGEGSFKWTPKRT
jgi:hypothetical protein